MPRRAADFRPLPQAQKNVCAAGEAAQTQKEPSGAKSDPGVGRCRAGDPAYLTYPLRRPPEGFTVTHSRGFAPHSVCPRQCRGQDRLQIFNLWLFTDNKISYYAGSCKVVGRKMWEGWMKNGIGLEAFCIPSCLSLWERCLSEAKTERGDRVTAKPLSAACGDSSPRGRAKGCPRGSRF